MSSPIAASSWPAAQLKPSSAPPRPPGGTDIELLGSAFLMQPVSMNLSRHVLYETFHEQAQWTSDIIQSGFSTRLGILEETITDMHLLAIARRHGDYVVTRKFSRKEEGSQSGADWLWCIGEPGAWFSLLV
jgi:hypothetical protein